MEPDMHVPHFNLADAEWVSLPEFGGSKSLIYRSPDGKRVAATYRESGAYSFDCPFDEMMYVVGGTASLSVNGQEAIELKPGDMTYLCEGWTISIDMSRDFHMVACLMSDREIPWR
jgi:uncharacterized cupin superfamily protein